jgi:hypothetical protein
MIESGEVTITLNWYGSTGHTDFLTDLKAGTWTSYSVAWTGTNVGTWTFTGMCSSIEPSVSGPDQVNTADVGFTIRGAVSAT